MDRRKEKNKARRRASKHVERAWKAADELNIQLARREIARALAERQDNPEIWNDQGLILEMAGAIREAERSFRNAIVIAPLHAEAHANLARLHVRAGRTRLAVQMQRRAVTLDDRRTSFKDHLHAYEAMVPDEIEEEDQALPIGIAMGRLDEYDWSRVAEELMNDGVATLADLLTPGECRELVSLFESADVFEKRVELSGAGGYGGEYRFFKCPLPRLVGRVRASVYERLGPIVNHWQALLGRQRRYPATHEQFLDECKRQGQTRSTPILLRYRAPAVNRLHRDVCGDVYFPLQLAVTLSSRREFAAGGCVGGEFVLSDDAVGARSSNQEVVTDIGDGVVFCTSERITRIGGSYAMQPVYHGMAKMSEGNRLVLGCPFHEYK